MNYEQKTFEELFEVALEDSVEKGLISHAEDFEDIIANNEDISNYYIMDKSVISNVLASLVYPDMTSVYESAKVIYAEGTDLDDIGDERGVPRPSASCAEVPVIFKLASAIDEDINISEGLIVSTETGIEYATLNEIYIPSGSLECTVQCRAVDQGEESKIIENQLVNIDENVNYDLSCINEVASSGGVNEYSDDEYRYLLMNWFKIHLKGSNEAFENYFANFDGLDGYKLIPNWDGAGTLKIILDPGTDTQLNKAYTDIQNSVAQMTEQLYLSAPIDKLIDIYAVVNVDIDEINPYSSTAKEDIKSRIITAITTFIDGGYTTSGEYYEGLLIGEDFIPHKLAVFVDDEIPELKNITFNYPTDYVPILDDEKGKKNNVTIEMI